MNLQIDDKEWKDITDWYETNLTQKEWENLRLENDNFRVKAIKQILNSDNQFILDSNHSYEFLISDMLEYKVILTEDFQKLLTFDQKIDALKFMLNFTEEHFQTQQELDEGILTFNDSALFKLPTDSKQNTIGFKIGYFDDEIGVGMCIPTENCHKVMWIYI